MGVGTGECPDACKPPSLAYTAVNKRETLGQRRCSARPHTQSCPLTCVMVGLCVCVYPETHRHTQTDRHTHVHPWAHPSLSASTPSLAHLELLCLGTSFSHQAQGCCPRFPECVLRGVFFVSWHVLLASWTRLWSWPKVCPGLESLLLA